MFLTAHRCRGAISSTHWNTLRTVWCWRELCHIEVEEAVNPFIAENQKISTRQLLWAACWNCVWIFLKSFWSRPTSFSLADLSFLCALEENKFNVDFSYSMKQLWNCFLDYCACQSWKGEDVQSWNEMEKIIDLVTIRCYRAKLNINLFVWQVARQYKCNSQNEFACGISWFISCEIVGQVQPFRQ